MQTDTTYPNIPSFRKIELEYLAWQITKIQAGTRNGQAKSNTGWKTCINALWIHTITK